MHVLKDLSKELSDVCGEVNKRELQVYKIVEVNV